MVKSILRKVWPLLGGFLFGGIVYQLMLKVQAESGGVVNDVMVWAAVIVNSLFAIVLTYRTINPIQNSTDSRAKQPPENH